MPHLHLYHQRSVAAAQMHPGQVVPIEEEHDHVERGLEVVSAGLGVAEAGVEGREDEVARE